MDVEIYSQVALGLPLTAMQASSRHPSHRARRGLLSHSSICVSFLIVCHTRTCRATDSLPNKVAGRYYVFSTLSSPGKFQVGLPRASQKAHGRSALAFFFFPSPSTKSGFRLVAFYLKQQNIYVAFGESLSALPNANANDTFTSISSVN